jgi:hypothetical protein
MPILAFVYADFRHISTDSATRGAAALSGCGRVQLRSATQCRPAFLFVHECFYPATPITQGTVSHPNDRQQRLAARGVIPYPIRADVEPLCDIFRC